MSHGPPPSDSEDDYDGFSVNLVYDDLPPPPQLVAEDERNEFFEKLKRSLTSGDLNVLRECFNDDEYIVNVNVKLFQERTPLLMACRSGSLECVQYLIGQGAKIRMDCNDTTCLMAVCEGFGDEQEILRLVQYLIENGAKVDHQDCNERTALMMACRNGWVEVVRCLLAHCDLEISDRWRWTALFYAVDGNQMEIVKMLVEKGAETELEDKKGYTLTQVAEMKGFHDIIQLLPQKIQKEYIVPADYLGYSDIRELIPWDVGLNPPYYADIKPILYGSGCENLLEIFAENRVNLFQFLTMTYEKLTLLGVQLPYERKKILHGLYRFHSQPWSKATLNKIDPKGDFDIYDVLTISTTSLKHSMIQLTSCYHITNNNQELHWDLPPKEVIRQTRSQIKTLRMRIRELQTSVKKVPQGENFTSIDYLRRRGDSKAMQKISIYCLTTVALALAIKYLINRRSAPFL